MNIIPIRCTNALLFLCMLSKRIVLSPPTLILLLGCVPLNSTASLVFTNLIVTTNSFSVDISGTVPDLVVTDTRLIVFESDPITTSPGWVIDSGAFLSAPLLSFSGSQTLLQFTTGVASYGDYIFHRFDSPLVADEIVSGTLFGRWGSTVFDPSNVGAINVYWGGVSSDPGRDGILIGKINAVPIPPTLLLFGSGLLGLVVAAKKKK